MGEIQPIPWVSKCSEFPLYDEYLGRCPRLKDHDKCASVYGYNVRHLSKYFSMYSLIFKCERA